MSPTIFDANACGPLVGVVILTHNRPELLREACESVWNQTYKNIRSVVVGNFNENEKSKAVLKELDADPRTDVVIFDRKSEEFPSKHCFESAARNFGASILPDVEYLCFLDDDDIYYPDRIERLTTEMIDRQLDLVRCDLVRVAMSPSDTRLRYSDLNLYNKRGFLIFPTSAVQMSSALFREHKWKEDIQSPRLGEDVEYWRRLKSVGIEMTYIAIVGGEYRSKNLRSQIAGLRKKRLCLHWGEKVMKGYISLNIRDEVRFGRAANLSLRPGFAGEIYAKDIIQRFGYDQLTGILSAWRKILKPGGVLKIETSDLQTLSQLYIQGKISHQTYCERVFGKYKERVDCHASGVERPQLISDLQEVGFSMPYMEDNCGAMGAERFILCVRKLPRPSMTGTPGRCVELL